MTLAAIGEITELKPIPNADLIQQATVVCGPAGKWSGVVGLDHHVGERVTVFMQDAILPPSDRWPFMERHKWRVKMARFKGVPSECVIVKGAPDLPIGTDMAGALGVTKHHKPLPESMNGEQAGAFPSFLPKTDELHFQMVDWKDLMKSSAWYVTEKADGASCTAYMDETGLHVCSRNFELREFTESGASNSYWRAARKYKLENMVVGTALQFELVGPGIQGNPMGLKEIECRLFGGFLRESRGTWKKVHPTLTPGSFMPLAKSIYPTRQIETDDDLRELAAIKYDNGKHGEGVVIRAVDQSWSFKVINLNYKD
jgi:RNA ligase (TIGR02306 family)